MQKKSFRTFFFFLFCFKNLFWGKDNNSFLLPFLLAFFFVKENLVCLIFYFWNEDEEKDVKRMEDCLGGEKVFFFGGTEAFLFWSWMWPLFCFRWPYRATLMKFVNQRTKTFFNQIIFILNRRHFDNTRRSDVMSNNSYFFFVTKKNLFLSLFFLQKANIKNHPAKGLAFM